jgi:hypothetical protein
MTPTDSIAEKASAKSAGEQSAPNFERVLRVQEQDVDRMGLAIAPMYARWME